MEMMQEWKARDNNKKVLKAQPHKPEFCRMQNSGLTLWAVVSWYFDQHMVFDWQKDWINTAVLLSTAAHSLVDGS